MISERERYKVLLDAEYGKVAQAVRESVKKFNNRLDELFILKLKIDSSICQYSLRSNRKTLRFHRQVIIYKDEERHEYVFVILFIIINQSSF